MVGKERKERNGTIKSVGKDKGKRIENERRKKFKKRGEWLKS